MLGAIAGDFIGSRFEARPTKSKEFSLLSAENRITDDSVLTIAVADCLMQGLPYDQTLRHYYHRYPFAGYGGMFQTWANSEDMGPYQSFGNGSAMRVSPVGWLGASSDQVLAEAKKSAEVTHNHPEGIKGAQAVALGIFLARQSLSRKKIKEEIQERFGYDLTGTLERIRPGYRFDVTCQGSVPQAFIAFLEAGDYEDAVRNAVSLGGDADTQACIAGALAEAFFGPVPDPIQKAVLDSLDDFLKSKVTQFYSRFINGS